MAYSKQEQLANSSLSNAELWNIWLFLRREDQRTNDQEGELFASVHDTLLKRAQIVERAETNSGVVP